MQAGPVVRVAGQHLTFQFASAESVAGTVLLATTVLAEIELVAAIAGSSYVGHSRVIAHVETRGLLGVEGLWTCHSLEAIYHQDVRCVFPGKVAAHLL